MFKIALGKSSPSTWRKQVPSGRDDDHIVLSVECEGRPNGSQISAALPRTRLLNNLPSLNNYLSQDNKHIVLPSIGEDTYDDTIEKIIKAVLEKSTKSAQLEILIEDHYMAIVQHHIVFVMLGMETERCLLENKLWYHLQVVELTLGTVKWVYETFGHFLDSLPTAAPYIPPYAALYVQGMAYQLLNLKAVDKLNPRIDEYICSQKTHSQYHLRQILVERQEIYGLEKGFKKEEAGALTATGVSKTWKDLALNKGSTNTANLNSKEQEPSTNPSSTNSCSSSMPATTSAPRLAQNMDAATQTLSSDQPSKVLPKPIGIGILGQRAPPNATFFPVKHAIPIPSSNILRSSPGAAPWMVNSPASQTIRTNPSSGNLLAQATVNPNPIISDPAQPNQKSGDSVAAFPDNTSQPKLDQGSGVSMFNFQSSGQGIGQRMFEFQSNPSRDRDQNMFAFQSNTGSGSGQKAAARPARRIAQPGRRFGR